MSQISKGKQRGQKLQYQKTEQLQSQCQFNVKIEYQQKDIQELKDQKTDLEKLIELNKQIIKQQQLYINELEQKNQMNQSYTVPKSSHFQSNSISKQEQTIRNFSSSSNSSKTVQVLMNQLFQENEKLYNIIKRLSEELEVAQGKALIYEQMTLISQEQESQTIDDLSFKIQILYKQLLEKDLEIKNCQQSGAILSPKGQVVTKFHHITDSKFGSVELNSQLEITLHKNEIYKQQIDELKESKNQLLILNTLLSTELQQLKDIQNSTNNFQSQHGQQICLTNESLDEQYQILRKLSRKNQDKKLPLNIEETMKNNSEEDSSLSDQQLPDKVVNKSQCNKSNTTENIVPKLDLSKPKQIQDTVVKKQQIAAEEKEKKIQQIQMLKQIQLKQNVTLPNLKQQQQQTSIQQLNQLQINKQQQPQQTNEIIDYSQGISVEKFQSFQVEYQQLKAQEIDHLTKITVLEDELHKTKILVQEEMLNSKLLSNNIDNLKMLINELNSRNETLIASNLNYERKWTKVQHALNFYKQYYNSQNKEFLQKKTPNQQDLSLLLGPKQTYVTEVCNEFDISDNFFTPESLVRFVQHKKRLFPVQEKPLCEIGENQLEVQSDRSKRKEIQSNLVQCKEFLLNLAKELYQNPKFRRSLFEDNVFPLKNKKRSKSIQPTKRKQYMQYNLRNLKSNIQVNKTRVFSTQTMKQLNQNNQFYSTQFKYQSNQNELSPDKFSQKKVFTDIKCNTSQNGNSQFLNEQDQSINRSKQKWLYANIDGVDGQNKLNSNYYTTYDNNALNTQSNNNNNNIAYTINFNDYSFTKENIDKIDINKSNF